MEAILAVALRIYVFNCRTETNSARLVGAEPGKTYWLKYPQTALMTAIEKTYIHNCKDDCPFCSGCVDLTTVHAAVSQLDAVIDGILAELDAFISGFVPNLVSLINS